VPGVTLQISLAPSDARIAGVMLPHQIRQWGVHAGEVLLALDLRPVQGRGRLTTDWASGKRALLDIVEGLRAAHPTIRVVEIDYSPGTARHLADRYFGGRPIPRSDHRSRPFYCYYAALDAAVNDHVLHIDSDILCGGGSSTWLGEAVNVLETRSEIMAVNPLPGPPTDNLELTAQRGEPVEGMRGAYLFDQISTRVFLMDRRVLARLRPPRMMMPRRARDTARALLYGRPLAPFAEDVMTAQMRTAGLRRFDFLGEPPGWWSLHPPYRSERFFAALPEVVRMVEEDDLPAGQRGDYELNESIIDWSDALAVLRATRWRR